MIAVPPLRRSGTYGPEFTRETWNSESDRELWIPRIKTIISDWRRLEWRSVTAGLRRCALVLRSDSEIAAIVDEISGDGLTAVEVARFGGNGNYTSAPRVSDGGHSDKGFWAVGKADAVMELKRYHDSHNYAEVGRLLGYPTCCVEFFEEQWGAGVRDTTWPMAVNTPTVAISGLSCDVEGPWQANMLLRWIGIRPVPHLPCSFTCAETVRFADSFLQTSAESNKYSNLFLKDMLSWSMEWSAQNGIAEIRVPLFSIQTATDKTLERYRVAWRKADK